MHYPLIDIDHFDYSILSGLPRLARPRGNQGRKRKIYYKDIICAFDIETTNLPDEKCAFMYVWQFQVGDICTVFGRTWDQFREFVRRIREQIQPYQVVVFVHNLSFEFQFLKGEFKFETEDVFFTDFRKVLKATLEDTLEFRCSYLQSGVNLDELCRRWGRTRKQSGKAFNYRRIRYPWTRLNRRERKYIQADVVGLVEAMAEKIKYTGDTLYTVPLTKTGYVRRDAKREMKKFNHYQLMDMQPEPEVMRMLLEAFRGGNTHANRYYAGDIINNVWSDDMASAYPGSECEELYPMSGWYCYQDPRNLTLDMVAKLIRSKHACLFRAAFWGVGLRNKYDGAPYIARHKCRNILNGIYDNGRVLYADYLETTLTDIDFKIIYQHYKFDDIKIIDLASSNYKPLPVFLLDVVRGYFQMKTLLKGGDKLAYTLAKEDLNSVYGMSVQNPVKQDIKLIDNLCTYDFDFDFDAAVEKANRKAFQCYAWGVWITAHTRERLQRCIDLAGSDFVYCDTDSVKSRCRLDLSTINDPIREKAILNKAYADDKKGVRHYMGVFELDAFYDRFITLGAKKYAYEQNGELGLTLAGVNKRLGAIELKKAGGLSKFESGFTFRKAGGTAALYNDNYLLTLEREGHKIDIRDNLLITDSEYTLGLTSEYMRILEHPALWMEMQHLITRGY